MSDAKDSDTSLITHNSLHHNLCSSLDDRVRREADEESPNSLGQRAYRDSSR